MSDITHKKLLPSSRPASPPPTPKTSDEQLIKQLEARGYAVGKWNGFDEEDDSTWPDDDLNILCISEVINSAYQSKYAICNFSDGIFFDGRSNRIVTHWQQLPNQPKE